MKFNEYFNNLSNKKVAVLGIAVSNIPLIGMLLDRGIDVTARDRRDLSNFGGELDKLIGRGLKLIVGEGYLNSLTEDVIYRTPGISPNKPELVAAKEHGSIISSEMEAFFEVCPCPIIAVTGSDGKTTTSALIAEILKSANFKVYLGGNIGKPLLEDVPDMDASCYAVVELSSFQLMGMDKSPHIAVITNLSPNHLDYHTDMSEYINAKKAILENQKKGDLLVLNLDNEITKSFFSERKCDMRFFSRLEHVNDGFWFDGTYIIYSKEGRDVPVINKDEIQLKGMHNIENLMAAFCSTADIAGIEACHRVASSFTGVEHRIEFVRKYNGVSYYNDAIATSPTRSIAGLTSFEEKLIIIAGGYDKKISYGDLGSVIAEKAKLLILSGTTSPKIKEAVENSSGTGEIPEIIECSAFESAVKLAVRKAVPGDTVILSPASASFDQFKNFAEKGRAFKEIIMSL